MVTLFVPKETEAAERRVAATPDSVKAWAKLGIEVQLQAGAGIGAGIADHEYAAAGAKLVEPADGYGGADVVLRVRTPEPEEVAALRPGSMLVCSMQPLTAVPTVQALAGRNVTAFALDLMPRITRAQKMDILSSQATTAGYQAVLLAAAALPKLFPLLMTAAGTLKPAKVFIMGVGVAGLQAIATARRLGAVVEANDVRPAVKEQVESLGAKFVDTTIQGGETAAGYAKEQSQEQLDKQREIVRAHVAAADVVITTAAIPGRQAPRLVTDDMLAAMRPGSVVVDLAVETGGNVEGSVRGERVERHGVLVIGDVNLPAQKAGDASRMFSRNVQGFLELVLPKGKLEPKWDDECVTATCVVRDGEIKHAGVAQALAGKGGA